jgi:hypothetical protein
MLKPRQCEAIRRVCNRRMARSAINLTALLSLRRTTWLVIAMIVMPFASATSVVDFGRQEMAQAQMSMSCEHGATVEMASMNPANMTNSSDSSCCTECEMPDCSTNTNGSVFAALGTEVSTVSSYNAGLQNRILSDLSQISAESDTPRKPPRV